VQRRLTAFLYSRYIHPLLNTPLPSYPCPSLSSTINDFRSTSSFTTTQGLEAYGIFKIGEIIGRRNLVGYKLQE
jgi:hypothetical protein